MKSFIPIFTCMTLAAMVGCSQGKPGGEGTAQKQPMYGQADDTFNLSVPLMSSSLQQGAQTEATVGIKRATNFDEDVTLKFVDLPKGVTIEPANPTIKHGESAANIVFTAADDASLGDFKIKVTGHPAKGSDAQVEFKMSVTPKDSFTLSVSEVSPLKQGTSQDLSIGILRDKTFDQDVALNFSDLPQGVTLEPSAPVIKKGETETKVTLKGSDDAALGDFHVKVTGHPTKGIDVAKDVQFIVVKK